MSKPIAWFPMSTKLPSSVRRQLAQAGYVVIQTAEPPRAITIMPVADGGNILAECAIEVLTQMKSDASWYTAANLKAWFADKVLAATKRTETERTNR